MNNKKRPERKNKQNRQRKPNLPKNPKQFGGLSLWIFLIIAALFLSHYMIHREEVEEIPYSEFRQKLEEGRLSEVKIAEDEIKGVYIDVRGEEVSFKSKAVEDPNLVEKLQEKGVKYEGEISRDWLQMIFFSFGPFILLIVIWIVIMRQFRSGGKQAMSFGKSKAKMYDKSKKKVTFKDVAGMDEAKEELQEIVEYLKNPKKFTHLGGKIPKGVLLYGPPGTGKTLLAKATAGEADVPFFSTSGSEFVEMFVGVGASRIRDMFEKGRKNAPCLIFIDELDAVGRSRFSGLGGGHDEREQTLNQILTELDGFDAREGVILIGATNRPDVLDPALLRKGRFDRHIGAPRPNFKERKEIFELHSKQVKISNNIDFGVLARRTPGFTGSDIANIINESALLAARDNAKKVTMHFVEEAIDRVIAGPAKKSRIISDKEKEKIAYHESGHTLVALHLENADPVHKVSILQRGPALGYTLQLPMEDRYLTTRKEIVDRMAVMLAGRAAEELIYGEKTTGARDDLRRTTEMAYKIVVEYGMSDELGLLTYQRDRENVFLGKEIAQGREYSELTAQKIDEGVKHIVKDCHETAKKILEKNKSKLKKLAKELIKKETIEGDEIKKILGIKKKQKKKQSKKKKKTEEKTDKKKTSKTKKSSGKKKKKSSPKSKKTDKKGKDGRKKD